MWDAAAQQMWMKKARIEKWCDSAAVAGTGGENQPLVIPLDHGEATPAWWSSDKFASQDGQDDWQWASDAFDGMDCDAAFLENFRDWSTDEVGNIVLTGRLSPQTQ